MKILSDHSVVSVSGAETSDPEQWAQRLSDVLRTVSGMLRPFSATPKFHVFKEESGSDPLAGSFA